MSGASNRNLTVVFSCMCNCSCVALSVQFPVLSPEVRGSSGSQEKQTWWEKALYSPLYPTSECEGKEAASRLGSCPFPSHRPLCV